MPVCKNVLSDSDALEVMALCERRDTIIYDLLKYEEKITALKKELRTLSDTEIAKDYNCKHGVIFGIRNGKTYKNLGAGAGRSKSGHQDILPTPSGKYRIYVHGTHVGVLKDLQMCVIVRDKYRAENNLPQAEY